MLRKKALTYKSSNQGIDDQASATTRWTIPDVGLRVVVAVLVAWGARYGDTGVAVDVGVPRCRRISAVPGGGIIHQGWGKRDGATASRTTKFRE